MVMVKKSYKINDNISFRRFSKDLLAVVECRNAKYYTLEDETSVHIWSMLARNKSFKHIVSALCDKWGLEPSGVEKDVKLFFDSLISKNLIAQMEGKE